MSTRLPLLDSRLLRSFLVLADELHYGRAAQRLFMTQPPLSKQIVRLEADLDVRLFERNRRGVKLTPAGKALVVEGRRLVAQAGQAIDTVRQVERGDSGRVRIAFNASSLFVVGEGMTRLLRERLPRVQFSWEEMGSSEQAQALLHDRIDIGLAQASDGVPGLQSRVIAHVPLVAAVPQAHLLAGCSQISLAQLINEDFVVVPREIGPGFFDLITSACVKEGFSPRIAHQARHLVTAVGLVATSGAVSLVPGTMALASVPGVRFLRLSGRAINAKYSIVWSSGNQLPVLPAVLTILSGMRGASRRRT